MADTAAVSGALPAGGHGVSLGEATKVWVRVAALSFGGPAGQIAVMHRLLVEEKRWISESRFLHALNYCMLLPGPEAQQLATYIGWLLHGTRGGLIAGGLFIVPGVIAIMALSYIYAAFGHVGAVTALFFGLKAAVLAIVLQAVARVGKRALANRIMVLLAGIAFVAIFFLHIPFPVIILAAAAIGYIGDRLGFEQFQVAAHGAKSPKEQPLIDDLLGNQTPDHMRPSWPRSLRVAAVWLALWLGPVALLLVGLGVDNVFSQIAVFFSKMAVVTFGGAYAVLAYVAQQAVENYHWLKPGEMLDGLGMAETTPGPLIMVLQFVGFLAAFRAPGGLPPMLAATFGGLLATWVTFTPCFFWIFLGAPFVEKLRGSRALTAALSAITAAVVGVILNLAIWFAIHTLFAQTEPLDFGPVHFEAPIPSSLNVWAAVLAAASLLAVFRFDVGMIPTLAAASAAGILLYALGGLGAPRAAAGEDRLRLEAKIPLGEVSGRIDHLAIDVGRQVLYVAELGNNSLGVVDVKARKLLRTLDGFSEPQGVLYAPASDEVYVANGGDGGLDILKADDLSRRLRIALGSDADNVRLDSAGGQIVVGYGDGRLAFIDPARRVKSREIALPAHPESFQFDEAGRRAYVNLPEAQKIAVVDPSVGKLVASWPQKDRANFALAVDPTRRQVIAAFRSPAVLGLFNADTGAPMQRFPTCADVDDLFVDAKRQQLYVICGAGAIDVFAVERGSYAPSGHLLTAPGARTGLFVPELDTLFVAVPASTQEPAGIWVFRPTS
jgi:chromate transporter